MTRTKTLPAPLSGILTAQRPTGVILGTILAFALVYGCLAGLGITYSILFNSQTMPPWMTVVVFGAIIALVFVWVKYKERRTIRSIGFARTSRPKQQILRGAALGAGLVALGLIALALLGQGTLAWNGNHLDASAWLMALVWLGIYAVQGSSEEIVFRGFLSQAYARKLGVIAAIILQAAMFAIMHSDNDGMGVLPVINLLLVAIALSFWSISEGSLWGVCAFHASWNWAQAHLFGIAVSGQGGNGGGIFSFTPSERGSALLLGGEFGLEGSIIVTIILAALALLYAQPLRRALAARSTPELLNP